jgi:hypothetical protein
MKIIILLSLFNLIKSQLLIDQIMAPKPTNQTKFTIRNKINYKNWEIEQLRQHIINENLHRNPRDGQIYIDIDVDQLP